jgi:hypothetical protein
MSPASTQRLTALGTLCRRPTVLLLPLAPLVLIAFLAATVISSVRASLLVRSTASLESADVEPIQPVTAEPVTITTRAIRAVRPTMRQLVGGTAALMGGVLIATSMAGGTYAFLNSQVKTSAVTISSGSLTLTVQYGSTAAGSTTAIPAASWTNMLPGDVVGQQFTLASTGSATSNVTARLAARPHSSPEPR